MQDYLLKLVEREAHLLQSRAVFERRTDPRVTIPAGADPAVIIREGRDGGFGVDRSESR